MNTSGRNIMIIAGEVSGDLHGASLVDELKKIDKDLNIYGIGGDRMRQAGVELIYHINKMAFLGFAEVVKHLPFIKRVQNDLMHIIKEKKIKNVVLIDYPGFNLNFANKIKHLGVNILYYISPQIWAWGIKRVKKIKKLVKKMFVVFPFEEEIYKKEGIPVEYVGHPLLERIKDYDYLNEEEFYKKLELDKGKEILLIMPGSRKHEIEKIFPECIIAADKLSKEFNLQIVVVRASNIAEDSYEKLTSLRNFKIIEGCTYDLMKHSKIGIIKSGTSTLEAALFELPMVIIYKTSRLTYLIVKNLINVKNIGMANIISGEKVVQELIQKDAEAEKIFSECKRMLSDRHLYDSIKSKLSLVKNKLGNIGASKRTAESIYAIMNEAEA
jgi:lipid-A-disaccharide synthase